MSVLEQVMAGPWPGATIPPEPFRRIIGLLMDQEDATDEPADRPAALAQLNESLKREGFEAFYGPDDKCHLRHIATNSSASIFSASPHRPFSTAEVEKRERLAKYLDSISEDEFIEEVLLPLFRQAAPDVSAALQSPMVATTREVGSAGRHPCTGAGTRMSAASRVDRSKGLASRALVTP